jgi:hypothetical protein
MTADTWVEIFIWAGAIPATLFATLYPALSPGWRRTFIGWALLISSSALALLLDLSLATKIFGPDFLARDSIRVTVVALVALGANLKFLALLVGKVRLMRYQRGKS